MVGKAVNFLLVLILSALILMFQPSTTSSLENDKLSELTERFDRMQTKMEAEIEKLTTKIDVLQSENGELKSDVNELKIQNSQQAQEILLLKKQISHLETLLPSVHYSSRMSRSVATHDTPSTRALTVPPSSCQELLDGNGLVRPMDGIHLLKNKDTNKIEAAFCSFDRMSTVVQKAIGNVDVKTKIVHFYVQKSTGFSTANTVIPFELAQLNEGNAFNLPLGIFTAPVPGIYHFDFSGTKSDFTAQTYIYFQVNGTNIGYAVTEQATSNSRDAFSLSASLRLAAGSRVNLFNSGSSMLFDDSGHRTHFSGWLVEEDLM